MKNFLRACTFAIVTAGILIAPSSSFADDENPDPKLCGYKLTRSDLEGSYILTATGGTMTDGTSVYRMPPFEPLLVIINIFADGVSLDSADNHLEVIFRHAKNNENLGLDSIPGYYISRDDVELALVCTKHARLPALTGAATGTLLSQDGKELAAVMNIYITNIDQYGIHARGIITAKGGGLLMKVGILLKPDGER